ncbi:Chromo domain-containing protein [Caenorhabditis elegans]|nr:Chromo domain-containing protein [Caenorhabditis elegans]CDH93329.1 Chromo domain-containing protein [Caenorhabditis elegans]|eukprot:NP_001294531.1 C.Elegans Chromodomain protein [Caenorhabditis elegans]
MRYSTTCRQLQFLVKWAIPGSEMTWQPLDDFPFGLNHFSILDYRKDHEEKYEACLQKQRRSKVMKDDDRSWNVSRNSNRSRNRSKSSSKPAQRTEPMTQREKFDAILQISEISLEKQYKLTNKKVPRRSQFTDPDAPKKKSKGARHYRDQNLKTLFKSSLIRKYRKPQESDDDLEPDVAQDSPENTPAPPTKSPESSGFSENLENLGANTPSPSPDFEEEHLEKKPETGNLTENRPKRVYSHETAESMENYAKLLLYTAFDTKSWETLGGHIKNGFRLSFVCSNGLTIIENVVELNKNLNKFSDSRESRMVADLFELLLKKGVEFDEKTLPPTMCAAVRSTRYDIRRDFRCLHNQYIDKRPRMCEWFSATGGGGSCGTTEICTFWNNDAGYLPNTHQRSKFHVDLSEFTGNNLGLLAFSMAWHEDFIDNNSGGPEIVKNNRFNAHIDVPCFTLWMNGKMCEKLENSHGLSIFRPLGTVLDVNELKIKITEHSSRFVAILPVFNLNSDWKNCFFPLENQ